MTEPRPTAPFGAVLELPAGTDWHTLDPEQVRAWVLEHRVLVLRGLAPLDKPSLPLAARRLGPLQAWSFGAVNVLEVDPDKENYLFTTSEVPLHWDGAFKREVPDFLMFRCVAAPGPEAGGGTVFVDAKGVWDAQPGAGRDQWRAARFRYSTERVVHYGGTIEAGLVAAHPVTGADTLRFAEPVDGLNPVAVEALHEGAPTVEDVARALADPKHRLVHHWRTGDVVLADNHALLHGREAFDADSPRELHRVNVLSGDRPWWRDWTDSLRIRRPEFMVAEIPILLIGLLWAAPDLHWLGTWPFWETLVVFFGLFHLGDMWNCLADRDLDALYKTSLSEAVYGLGPGRVRAQIAVTLGVVALGTLHLAWTTAQPWLVPLVAMGVVLGHQYSFPPLRFKARGLWQFLVLWVLIFVGPMLFVSGVLVPEPRADLYVLIGLYGAMAQSIVLVNTAEDYDEDVAAGLTTSAVALGRERALWASSVGVGGAGAGLLGVFARAVLTEAAAGPVWFVLGLWTSAWAWTTLEIGHLAWRVRHARDPDGELKRGAVKMPVWITVMAWLTLTVVGVRAWG